jgi:hypothetical protein
MHTLVGSSAAKRRPELHHHTPWILVVVVCTVCSERDRQRRDDAKLKLMRCPCPHLQGRLRPDAVPSMIAYGMLVQPVAIHVLIKHYKKGLTEPPFLRERRQQLCKELDELEAREAGVGNEALL